MTYSFSDSFPGFDPANYSTPVARADWLDSDDDVTFEEANMREIEFDDDNAEWWQTYGEAEMRAEQADWEYEAALGMWDDDPNPYHGDYSEM